MAKIDNLEYWVQRTIPQVYDDSLSFQELLAKVLAKLNEVVDELNEYTSQDLEGMIATKLNGWYEDGTLATVINQDVFNMKADKDDVERQMLNITDYGAVGDGVTDDTQAIQATINKAITAGYHTVYIPDGKYLFSELTISDSIEIKGSGTLLLMANRQQAITISGKKVVFDGFTIDGNKANQLYNHNAIYVTGEQITIKNMKFKDCFDKIIYLEPTAKNGTISNNLFENNGVTGNCNAISVKANNTRVVNNTILNHGNGHGVRTGYFTGEAAIVVQDILIHGNLFDTSLHNAVTLELGSTNITISNNIMKNCPQAIKAEAGASKIQALGNTMMGITLSTAFNLLSAVKCVVQGNTMEDCSGSMNVGDFSTVTGNKILNCVGGITARNNCTVVGNHIENCGARPVNIYSGVFSENIIKGCKAETSGYIIQVGNGYVNGVTCRGNQIIDPLESGNTITAIMVQGYNIIVTDNVLIDTNGVVDNGVYVFGTSSDRFIVKNNILPATLEKVKIASSTGKLMDVSSNL